MNSQLLPIFCYIHDFCKQFVNNQEMRLLGDEKRKRNRPCKLNMAEIMTILVMFQISNYKTFKHFYKSHVLVYWQQEFPGLLSYQRFVEIKKFAILPLLVFLHQNKGAKTGKYFTDATALVVCHNLRIYRHRVFKGLASRGKTSTGWFFGFKLHLIFNHLGQLMNFYLTAGNVDDRAVLERTTKGLRGWLFGDRGYIGKKIADFLASRGLDLFTKARKNMKPKTYPPTEQFYLDHRGSLVETIIGQLKNQFCLEHSRHRSVANFLVNILSTLTAYFFKQNKVCILPDFIPTFSPLLTSN